MQKIDKVTAVKMILNSRATIFTVTFVKRTNKEVRTMNCRLGVSKGVNGKGMSFDAAEKGLIKVYDIANQGYRMIPVESIRELKIQGNKFQVV